MRTEESAVRCQGSVAWSGRLGPRTAATASSPCEANSTCCDANRCPRPHGKLSNTLRQNLISATELPVRKPSGPPSSAPACTPIASPIAKRGEFGYRASNGLGLSWERFRGRPHWAPSTGDRGVAVERAIGGSYRNSLQHKRSGLACKLKSVQPAPVSRGSCF